MNLIAFITDGPEVRKILTHIGAEPEAPRITPTRGPPLWEDCDAPQSEAAGGREPDWDFAQQVAPDVHTTKVVTTWTLPFPLKSLHFN